MSDPHHDYLLAHLKQAIGEYAGRGFGDDAIVWAAVDEAGPVAAGGCRPLRALGSYSSREKLRELVPGATGDEGGYTVADVKRAVEALDEYDYPDTAIIWANVPAIGPVDRYGARPLMRLQAFKSAAILAEQVPGSRP